MKLVFIDPVNVLNSQEYRKKLLQMNGGRNYDNFIQHEFESSKITSLKRIFDTTNSKMVLYTKDRCCSQKIGALLNKLKQFGLPNSYWFDTLPDSKQGIYETQLQWISNKGHLKIEKYVIIDSILNNQTPQGAMNAFLLDADGLTEDVANTIIQFLT